MVTGETLKHYKNKITYAQNREDLLLEAFFHDQKKGFYVDVGGFDPDYDSVTKLFYLKGWSGINIEPQPDQYKKFEKRRKRDINIDAAISDTSGTTKLRIYQSGGLSTLSNVLKKKYAQTSSAETDTYKEEAVRLVRLDDLFKKYNVTNIDFMKVDVEGLEKQVLKSNNWKKYRPRVLCVEAGISDKEVNQYLATQCEYTLVFNDGLNNYFVDRIRNEFHELPFIEHVLIRRGSGVRYEDYRNIAWLFHRMETLQTQLDEESRRHIMAEEGLRKENEYLHQVLNDARALLRKSLKMYSKKIIKKAKGGKYE